MGRGPTPVPFWHRVEVSDGCWQWIGAVHKRTGYGAFSRNLKSLLPHRVAYEEMRGPIPEGLQLDHLCRNRLCVNPDHLEAVTGKVNNARSLSPTAMNAKKTHCPQGHEYDYVRPERRACKQCARERQRRWRARRAA